MWRINNKENKVTRTNLPKIWLKNSAVNPVLIAKETDIVYKEADIADKEPDIVVKEKGTVANEPYTAANEPVIVA